MSFFSVDKASRSHQIYLSVCLAGLLLFAGCSASYNPERSAKQAGPPPSPEREFRGAWIATVANIDWPSSPDLTAIEQQAELRQLLDRLASMNMNAVILQVRPAADAFYASAYEPWSWYLSGEMGRPPSPYYDPLAFAIEEAHARGLELHAWFNPFRAGHRTFEGTFSPDHITVQRPDLVVEYGEQFWMDPGMPDAREHSLRVMLDVVRRYDLDGLHMDDYFYPYPVNDDRGRQVSFPDSMSWQIAQERGARITREDWRRQNINTFVETLYSEVKAIKPWVKVGLSPFGIWRPGYPDGVRGLDAYNQIYADARLWLQQGWIDYLSPQLYWEIDSDGQPYAALYSWWRRQNTKGRHVWPGNAIYRVESHKWPTSEIINQVKLTRAGEPYSGNVLFSMRILNENVRGLSDKMTRELYSKPALVPPMPWLGGKPLDTPMIAKEEGGFGTQLSLRTMPGDEAQHWLIRIRLRARWYLFVEPGALDAFPVERHFGSRELDEIVVSFVDRVGRESDTATIRREIVAHRQIGF
ncbi:MAG: family 10 glycosylhydrolase [Bacteroidota bacterium]